MKKQEIKVPDSVRACLWFTHPQKLDYKQEKTLIITQVLNRGTWDAVRWVYNNYGPESLRDVVKHPERGLWFPQALQFWVTYFRIHLRDSIYQKALLRMNP